MLVLMHTAAADDDIDAVVNYLRQKGLQADRLPGGQRVAIGVTGNKEYVDSEEVVRLPGVVEVMHVTKPYKKVSREFFPEDSHVHVGEADFGGARPVLIAGPCSVESEEQVVSVARFLKERGVEVLRGGIFKPRTSPYSFQGIGYVGLNFLKTARAETGLPICVEIMSIQDIEIFDGEVDIIQIGARSMQNFDLLKRLAKLRTPVMLKRGPWATVDEFLLAAEYLLDGGNDQVILCERGIKSFENSTRNLLDLNSLALIRELSHLPIIADPAHAGGKDSLVAPLGRAALAAGANGLMVEVHPDPLNARSDPKQQLSFDQFDDFLRSIALYRESVPSR